MAEPEAPTAPAPGTAVSEDAAERLARFEAAMTLPLVLSAVLPVVMFIVARRTLVADVVYIVSWMVFILDYLVHTQYLNRYLRTRRGQVDLLVVVLTAPWFLIFPYGSSKILAAARFARLGRLVLVTKQARRLVDRLGRAAIVFAALVLVCGHVAYQAEHAVNHQFDTYSDALWWAVVTICTVGYGDIVPVTAGGRLAGVILMVAGIGIIGALAGSLASFLRLAPSSSPAAGSEPTTPPERDGLAEEIASLRTELGALQRHLDRLARSAGAPGAPLAEDDPEN